MVENSPERHIWLEGCFNFRDLGGYTTNNGATLRWRRLFRSGEVSLMTSQDADTARVALGIRTVVDLRKPSAARDAEQGPLTQPPVRHQNVPISSLDEFVVETGWPASIEEQYLIVLRHPEAGQRIGQAISCIAEGLPEPVVFHCLSGKDRTGLVAMVLLGSLGVLDELIADDFVLTQLDMERILNRHRLDPELLRILDSVPEWSFQAPPNAIKIVLATLKSEFGSIRGYAAAQGVGELVFERLENTLLM